MKRLFGGLGLLASIGTIVAPFPLGLVSRVDTLSRQVQLQIPQEVRDLEILPDGELKILSLNGDGAFLLSQCSTDDGKCSDSRQHLPRHIGSFYSEAPGGRYDLSPDGAYASLMRVDQLSLFALGPGESRLASQITAGPGETFIGFAFIAPSTGVLISKQSTNLVYYRVEGASGFRRKVGGFYPGGAMPELETVFFSSFAPRPVLRIDGFRRISFSLKASVTDGSTGDVILTPISSTKSPLILASANPSVASQYAVLEERGQSGPALCIPKEKPLGVLDRLGFQCDSGLGEVSSIWLLGSGEVLAAHPDRGLTFVSLGSKTGQHRAYLETAGKIDEIVNVRDRTVIWKMRGQIFSSFITKKTEVKSGFGYLLGALGLIGTFASIWSLLKADPGASRRPTNPRTKKKS